MKENRRVQVCRDCLKKNKIAIIMMMLISAMNLTIFILYDVMIEPLFYSLVLSVFFFVVLFTVDCVKEMKRAKEWEIARKAVPVDMDLLPKAQSISDKNYQELLYKLSARLGELSTAFKEERQDMLDYYTAWVHQIKTPIAVMKLQLAEDENNRELLAELFRIEQYVDMVLQYIRLGSGTNDLLIQEYSLDEMIRESIRKYASQFVGKRLKLRYEPTEKTIVTDRKWFCCILEQFISNAIKYTPSGTIEIKIVENKLIVSDTGIGIMAEDLPRIFEKGYTGINGRIGQKSSGLGLYLAKKAANLIDIPISAESKVGEGSRFCMELPLNTTG